MSGNVAKVVVDVSLPHLDRAFDYAVPDSLLESAQPGTRVRVRFSGRLVDGFVVGRSASSDHRLQPLQRVVSTVPVLRPEVLELCRAVADRYAGSLPDVLRAAVPPRHARAESLVLASDCAPEPLPVVSPSPAWEAYSGGTALRDRLASGQRGVRAVWTAAPGGAVDPAGDWPSLLAGLAVATAHHGGVVIVVPDARDLARVDRALTEVAGPGCHAVLAADVGPQRRYAEFLRVLTGRVRIVVGTRAAAFAPVIDPVLFMSWDDGDESMSEPHAPGWHAREVLAVRAHQSGASLVAGGFTRSAETQAWVESSWAAPIVARRDVVRGLAPRVLADDSSQDAGPARLPHRAWDIAKASLREGPVLVQVARRGYLPSLACQDCRAPARCPACAGPLAVAGTGSAPVCRWCSTSVSRWRCQACGSGRLRASSVGTRRTAEELGRAFPGVPVVTSGGSRMIEAVDSGPALVVCTPGAEPVAADGYAAVLLLDAHAHLARVALRAGEETARRWFAAAALARPSAHVVVTSDASSPIVQALIRWDPAWLSARELAERTALHMPPAVRAATLTGSVAAVQEAAAGLPSTIRCLGPLPVGDGAQVRVLLTTPRADGEAMASALHAIAASRSARKDTEPLSISVDPLDWGTDERRGPGPAA